MARDKKLSSRAITVRIPLKEFNALKAIARRTGQSMSETVRNVIRYDIIKYAEKNKALKVLLSDVGSHLKKNKKCRG